MLAISGPFSLDTSLDMIAQDVGNPNYFIKVFSQRVATDIDNIGLKI